MACATRWTRAFAIKSKLNAEYAKDAEEI